MLNDTIFFLFNNLASLETSLNKEIRLMLEILILTIVLKLFFIFSVAIWDFEYLKNKKIYVQNHS